MIDELRNAEVFNDYLVLNTLLIVLYGLIQADAREVKYAMVSTTQLKFDRTYHSRRIEIRSAE